MKLHEAIRLGAMMKPQGFGEFVNYEGHTCALGAACDACGEDPRFAEESNFIERRFAVSAIAMSECPVGCSSGVGLYQHTVGGVIAHLNDHHTWTRERIADWVETLEKRETERSASATSSDAVREETDQPVLTICA